MARQLALSGSASVGSPFAGVERHRPEATPLYAIVHAHVESFLAAAERRDRVVPRFVERELRAYLECGLLQFGFVRVRCESCGHSRLVAFSCKGRNRKPLIGSRRGARFFYPLASQELPPRVSVRVGWRGWYGGWA